jgi:4-hydroxy-3-polyprenylbenzoate decarboxylase
VRELVREAPADWSLPAGFSQPRIALPGVVVVQGPRVEPQPTLQATEALRVQLNNWSADIERLCAALNQAAQGNTAWKQIPLVVVVDDSSFTAHNLSNFLWVTFTRSNPAADIYGVGSSTIQKHWGCTGPLVIDARIKPHHAPALVEDEAVTKRIDALASRGGPLARWL